ncbi:Canalicular multispecific organic anion transporter 1 AltName: Full=ATP-binding cassette sub-family C member 2; AltName: Full=Canalicular multidrug resistance protein; AltName: Full=Multidrug resistance-associated protein 2 [Serendipita indica DSM 11827]|nr:Canalicular multispecific organic anion transporter 1 AltName: Full=ATP-binding cassette sub-family C member 2; AltName: Full=Canalicular multidrug resistance protein; AltName: Full=Multidrug resistance-associated protein 2 [Serendipita indica DSM 11827]
MDDDRPTTHPGLFGKLWRPTPSPPGFAAGAVIPEIHAKPWSIITFGWLSPILRVGFSRPLEVDDLWVLDDPRLSENLGARLERNFYERCPPEKRPRHIQEQGILSARDERFGARGERSSETSEKESPEEIEHGLTPEEEKRRKKAYDEALVFALEKTFRYKFWMGGIVQLIGDSLSTTSPLVTKALLNSSSTRKGIGLAFGLFLMQQGASVAHNYGIAQTMTVGLLIRSTIIGQIFRKSLRLSGRARVEHSTGKITTMLSTDTTRLDFALGFCHSLWISPLMIILALGLLIGNLGYSALVSVGVLLLGFPAQGIVVKFLFNARKDGIVITDSRVRLLQEIIQGIRLVKIYAWETLYGHKVDILRRDELKKVRTTSVLRSTLISLTSFIPILAAILAFITYSLTGHPLDPAIIFSSLQMLNVLRMPLIMLPFIFSLSADGLVSLKRIGAFLTAEELSPAFPIDSSYKFAVDITDGSFTWEVADPAKAKGEPGPGKKGGADKKKEDAKAKDEKKKQSKKSKKAEQQTKKDQSSGEPSPSGTIINEPKEGKEIFKLKNIDMHIAKGQFIGIVGKVGSGKSSLLNALIGEMRKTNGSVSFNGTIAYTPQNPWLANATVRDNILFGNPYDEARFRDVVRACSLEPDFEMLPQGEQTEIGEKGINLSGGQKARVSLARVAYSKADVVFLDDPLSAVDAHVGKSILEDCLTRGPLAGRTRILVTHALSALPRVDYIYVLDKGEIVEHGTYQDLIEHGPVFSKLIAEYGGTEATEEKEKEEVEAKEQKAEVAAAGKPLMQEEDRNTGQIQWYIYGLYITAAGGFILTGLIILMLLAEQAAQIVTTLFLGWWTSRSIRGFGDKEYMALYAGIGGVQAVIAFLSSFAFALAGLRASRVLFRTALTALMRSPVSFYDTTPVGRILSRLSRDIESLDNQLPSALFQLMRMLAAVLGAIALIFYTFPYLGIAIPFLFILYYIASAFYRRTSIETKRLDSVLRSALYSSLGEALTGLSTIHAWRTQDRYIKVVDAAIDNQNRAYIVSVLIQRWLAMRLDFIANLLILGIGLFAVGVRNTSNPSKTGVVLSYTLAITQTLSQMVTQMARSEQEMNAVERLDYYGKLPQEAPPTTKADPDQNWPDKGAISFNDVKMAYRPGLLSSCTALFRIVEIEGGTIEIDGVDTRKIGLDVLRRQMAVIPQDALLFRRSTRNAYRRRALSALRRAGLLDTTSEPGTSDAAEATKGGADVSRFELGALVSEGGTNFSAGERQLLALCRALVKESRVIVMDEATSNVDVETDAKIQRTIQTEFAKCTLLCIAHRLNTIVYYDRILVLDAGRVAEFDTPLGLYDREGSIFRSLCSEASLNRQDIIRIRKAVHPDEQLE